MLLIVSWIIKKNIYILFTLLLFLNRTIRAITIEIIILMTTSNMLSHHNLKDIPNHQVKSSYLVSGSRATIYCHCISVTLTVPSIKVLKIHVWLMDSCVDQPVSIDKRPPTLVLDIYLKGCKGIVLIVGCESSADAGDVWEK